MVLKRLKKSHNFIKEALPEQLMAQYQFFRSEKQQYSLGNVELPKAREMFKDLIKVIREAPRIHEAVAVMIAYESGHYEDNHLSGDEAFLAEGINSGKLTLKTEQLYLRRRKLLSGGNLLDLASFRREGEEVLFQIRPLDQLGVNPQFLYDFGDRNRKIIENSNDKNYFL